MKQKSPTKSEAFIEKYIVCLFSVTRVRLELTANGLKDHCRDVLNPHIIRFTDTPIEVCPVNPLSMKWEVFFLDTICFSFCISTF